MLTSEINKTKSGCEDGTETYQYGFQIWSSDEIRVVISNKVAPLEKDELTLDTDYTVAGVGAAAGGTITLDGTYADGEADHPDNTKYITIIGELEFKQEVDVDDQGSPYGNVHERAWDRLTRLCQQLNERVSRCFTVDETSDEDPEDMTLETVVDAPTDVTNFDGVLSGSDTTIQTALETIDDNAATHAELAAVASDLADVDVDLGKRAKTKLDEVVISGAATGELTDANAADYDALEIEFVDVLPVNTPVDLYFRLSEDLGVSWEQGASDYMWQLIKDSISEDPHDLHSWDASDTDITLVEGMGNVSEAGVSGLLRIQSHGGGDYVRLTGTFTYRLTTGNLLHAHVLGSARLALAADGFQVWFSAGNIASGTIRLWGLPKGS